MSDHPYGPDTMAIPAYLATGDGVDDPGLERWKQDHPDWFVAGTWTLTDPESRPTPPVPSTRDTSPDTTAAGIPNPDPAMSIAEFRRIADTSRTTPPPDGPTAEPSLAQSKIHVPSKSELAYPDIQPPQAMPP